MIISRALTRTESLDSNRKNWWQTQATLPRTTRRYARLIFLLQQNAEAETRNLQGLGPVLQQKNTANEQWSRIGEEEPHSR